MRYTMKTLEQLKEEYINVVSQIIDLGQAEALPSINESVFKALNKLDKNDLTNIVLALNKLIK